MNNIDKARQSFEKYKQSFKQYIAEDLNESDTRSKLIDNILINVLGWEEADIRREGHVDSGYFDYKISIPGIHFIVEAKRQFIEFKLPANHKMATTKSLQGGNKEVIKQIRDYTIDESIQYGIITNGTQFIFIKTINTDNTDWKSNNCLIFNGIQDVENRFVEFYDNLSKHSLIFNGGFKYDLPISTIENKTILTTLIDRDKELIRNSLSANITPLIDTIFGEIFSEEREDDAEFIKECFVENEETKKNKNEIERLFGDFAPEITNVIPVVNTSNLSTQIISEISSDEISIKNNFPPKPIIIIGSKGAGKTTFINHLFKYKLNNEEIENHFLIYIDFRKFFETETNFEPEKIAADILDKIYTKYEALELHTLKVMRRMYITEIKRNEESTWKYDKDNDEAAYQRRLSLFLDEAKSNNLKHLEFLSKYLIRERRKRLIVIVDNADQFNDFIQEKLFIFSHSLTKATLCGTVISLREGYYYKWQNSPPFDAYESNVYHITAPNYIEILQKRIDYAIQKAPHFEKKVSGTNHRGLNYNFPANYITNFLSGLKYSIFLNANSSIIDFLNHTTYPNIREGLKVFKSFLTSGHTKVADYILREQYKTENQKTHSVIPLHEFFKSIALQNRHYYNSEKSLIYNLFVPPIDSIDHFIKIYILKDLNEFIEKKSYIEKLIPNTTILGKLNQLGYKINAINSAISSLLKASLIDTDEQLSDVEWNELPSSFNLCLTAKGHFYLMSILNRFHYLDLVSQDTPIYDTLQFDKISALFPLSNEQGVRNIVARVDCMRQFISYLKEMELRQPAQVLAVYGDITNTMETQIEAEIGRMK